MKIKVKKSNTLTLDTRVMNLNIVDKRNFKTSLKEQWFLLSNLIRRWSGFAPSKVIQTMSICLDITWA
jgi:hypothetical protein